VSKYKSKYDRVSSVVAGPGASSSSPLALPSVQPSCGGSGARGGRIDGDRILRPSARGAVSLREHLSPTRQPPPVAAFGVAEPDGMAPHPVDAYGLAEPDKAAPVRSPAPPPPLTLPHPTPRLHAVPSHGSPPSSCDVVPASATSAGSRAGSYQLCTTDLVGAATQKVVQRKL
jgi:hypothetical protein